MSAGPGHGAVAPGLRPAIARGRWSSDGIDVTEAFSRGVDVDRDWMGWGALRVLSRQAWASGAIRDDGRVANMERLVLVLDGALDVDCGDLGRHRVARGDALWMGAGHGMQSRLANASAVAPLRLLECWLQPDRVNASPALAVRVAGSGADPEVGTGDPASAAGAWITLAAVDGRKGSLPLRQQARIMAARIDAGATLALPSGSGGRYWLEVLEGAVIADGPRLAAGDGLGWTAGGIAGPGSLTAAGVGTAWLLLFELPA
ncbi:hypothetical protein [Luteimonas terricola]|uniref:Quercetin 2,3-dioxygenase C-terminal cupin domain-containing protein n=1 Tax=Luteimonas terricola TaxID=645597 RepID=A0ABQ2E6U6_9GAMM|nr:hypothetical protein [Luteimonas terricola]GGJ98436.1 hypothetical protein GCM10011394_04340 [Luteimonas terricola]